MRGIPRRLEFGEVFVPAPAASGSAAGRDGRYSAAGCGSGSERGRKAVNRDAVIETITAKQQRSQTQFFRSEQQ